MKIEPDSLSPSKRYFLLTSCVIPRPIAWVGTVNEDGSNNLAPFSFFNAFSSTPPILGMGFSPHEEKTEKDTLRNVRRTGELTVNLATTGLVQPLVASSHDLPYGEDEFEHAGLKAVPSETIGAPRVGEAPISFECVTWKIIPLGDAGSQLLLAELKMIHVIDELLDDRGTVDNSSFDALARLGAGQFAGLREAFVLK